MNGQNKNAPWARPGLNPGGTPPPPEWLVLQHEARTIAHPIVPDFAIARLPGGFSGNLPAVANTHFHQWLQQNPPLAGNTGGPTVQHPLPVLPPPRLAWAGQQMPHPQPPAPQPIPQQPVLHQPIPQYPHIPPAIVPPPTRPPGATRRTVNTRIRNNTSYSGLLRDRPQSDARPPLNIDISMVEICTFFPSWFVIPPVVMRAMRNGFTRNILTGLMIVPVNRANAADKKTTEDRLQQQISAGRKLVVESNARWNTATYIQRVGVQNDFTANNWKQRVEYEEGGGVADWDDVELLDIGSAVPRANWPTGDDRLLLTRCLELAAANPTAPLTTQHWGWLIQNYLGGAVLPPAPAGLNVNRDTVAVSRLFS